MNVISRGVRNAFRNRIRTGSIIVILALSIGLALTMVVARQAVENKISSVKSSIGNTITVSPAGARGFQGGGNPLTADDVTKVKSTTHVVSVTQTLQDRLESSQTNLVSAIEAGTLGRRFNGGQAPDAAGGSSISTDTTTTESFTPPIMVTGTSDPTSTSSLMGGGTIKLTSGSNFDGASTENVAIIGESLATKNNLAAGSTFTAYGATIKVVGIFDAGNTFSNSAVIMPIATVQTLSQQPGEVSSIVVQVDSITNLDGTTTSLKSSLGDGADVVSQEDTSNEALAPLESIKKISLYSVAGALIAGAAIILLTMLMIVRERRREIGVLKAIGASNVKVVGQFIAEAVTFTAAAAVVGLGIGVAAAGSVTNALVTNVASSATGTATAVAGGVTRATDGAARFGGPGGGRGFARVSTLGGEGIRNVHAAVGWDILLYGLAAALVIAVIGSAIPAFLIAKVRPAEVMRAE